MNLSAGKRNRRLHTASAHADTQSRRGANVTNRQHSFKVAAHAASLAKSTPGGMSDHERAHAARIQREVVSAMPFERSTPSSTQGEQQALIEPPELPKGRRSPSRTRSGVAERDRGAIHGNAPSMAISAAAGRDPGVASAAVSGISPSTSPEVDEKVDKVSDLFKSLENMREEIRPTMLRRIFCHIIDPQSPKKRIWDLFVLLLVVFSALYEPYNAAFRPTNVYGVWWEWAVDV